MRAERKRSRILGILETTPQRTEARGTGTTGVSDESKLLAGLHSRTDCGRLSRSGVVPLLHAGRAGTDYPGAPDQRQHRQRIRVRKESDGLTASRRPTGKYHLNNPPPTAKVTFRAGVFMKTMTRAGDAQLAEQQSSLRYAGAGVTRREFLTATIAAGLVAG